MPKHKSKTHRNFVCVVRFLNDGDNHGTLKCENLGYYETHFEFD